jgi:hypothetical protein
MKPLEKAFDGRGEVKEYTFIQMPQSIPGVKYLYQVESEGHIHYEVFIHKENNYFDCVSYPKAQSFGKWAWTCLTLQRALDKLEWIDSYLEELKTK